MCRTYRCARRWRRLPRRRRCERTLALALARGVDWRDGHAHTALHHAAKAGDVHAVRRLIELGATVGAADRRGITPLHVASCQRHVDVVRLLVAAGADPNLKHYSGLDCAFDRPLVLCKSSLEMAAERGFDDVVSALKKERICSSEDQLSRDAIIRLFAEIFIFRLRVLCVRRAASLLAPPLYCEINA